MINKYNKKKINIIIVNDSSPKPFVDLFDMDEKNKFIKEISLGIMNYCDKQVIYYITNITK